MKFTKIMNLKILPFCQTKWPRHGVQKVAQCVSGHFRPVISFPIAIWSIFCFGTSFFQYFFGINVGPYWIPYWTWCSACRPIRTHWFFDNLAFHMMMFLTKNFSRRSSWGWFWKTLSEFHLFPILGVFGNLMLWRSLLIVPETMMAARRFGLGVVGGGSAPTPPNCRPKGLRNVGLWASPRLRLRIAVGKY